MNDEGRAKLGLLPKEPVRYSDTDLVSMLRSGDHLKRNAALQALFPNSRGAVLMVAQATGVEVGVTPEVDAGRVFNGLLWLAQRLGKSLGLSLSWVPEAEDLQKLVVAQPGVLVP